jgi:hypothetical protein
MSEHPHNPKDDHIRHELATAASSSTSKKQTQKLLYISVTCICCPFTILIIIKERKTSMIILTFSLNTG